MLSDFFEPFTLLEQAHNDTEYGTGAIAYNVGATFYAGISQTSTSEAQIAERQGMKTIYTIIHPPEVHLRQDDRVRRERDQRVYRITGSSNYTPDRANVQYGTVNAEVIA